MAATINTKIRTAWGQLRVSSAAVKILWLNIGAFVVLRVAGAASVISGHEVWIDSILSWTVEVPSDLRLLTSRPWTLLTYMFAQYEVWHAMFNLLFFYWFATVFLNLYSSRRLWELYILSGLIGALSFVVCANIFPGFSQQTEWLIGSSASVLGVTAATSLLYPAAPMTLFFIGRVKLKWVGLATILLTLAGGLSTANQGGNLAHIGGIVSGVVYALLMKRAQQPAKMRFDSENIPAKTYRNPIAPPFTPRRPISQNRPSSVTHPNKKEDIEQLNSILDKIKVSGYDALTPRERKILFEVSSRIK